MIGLMLKLLIAAFIIRFHVNTYRLGPNPIVSTLNQFTDPFVLPFKPLFKNKRYDFSSIVVALIIALLGGVALNLIGDVMMVSSASVSAVEQTLFGFKKGIILLFLSTWIDTVFYTMLIAIIGSWLQTDPRQPLMQVCLSCSEWLLAPIRNVLPSFGGLDFSPLIALLLISLARNFLVYLL